MSWLFPYTCPLCGQISAPVLFPKCAAEHPPELLVPPMLLDVNGRVLYRYAGAARDALDRFKFRGKSSCADGFGRLIAQYVDARTVDVVTYVPMDFAKQARRGYNQAELLARYCAHALNRPCRRLLTKTRRTQTQHLLSAAKRRENVEGAYRSAPLNGARILLCDDIVTTGATLRSCAGELRRAGAGSVQTFCIAWSSGTL